MPPADVPISPGDGDRTRSGDRPDRPERPERTERAERADLCERGEERFVRGDTASEATVLRGDSRQLSAAKPPELAEAVREGVFGRWLLGLRPLRRVELERGLLAARRRDSCRR